MAVLHRYDYIFVITAIFAFLDAWNIGKQPSLIRYTCDITERSK